MTQEECIQAREINATHQGHQERGVHCVLWVQRFGELEIFEEQVRRLQLLPVEEICQFCQAVKWKDETANSCCRSGKVVLASLHDPSQEFKQLFIYPLL